MRVFSGIIVQYLCSAVLTFLWCLFVFFLVGFIEFVAKQELSCWYLFGVSEAARNKHCIQLKIGDNHVGKSSASNSIVLPSTLVSRHHCNLVATDSEVILRDLVSTLCAMRSIAASFVNGFGSKILVFDILWTNLSPTE